MELSSIAMLRSNACALSGVMIKFPFIVLSE